MNNDLISRSALKEATQKLYEETPDGIVKFGIEKTYDLIDNAPTVSEITKEKLSIAYDQGYEDGKNNWLQEERPQGEWVPVSERLPEDMQRVLIWFEYYRYGDFNCMYQTYGFGYVCDGKRSPFINGETGWQDYKVIAWQPLPKPYKKGE